MGSSPPKKKVLLMTATGSYNLGDEVILAEELRFLQGHYGDMAEFVIFTHDPTSTLFHDPTVRMVSYFPSNFFGNFFGNLGYLFQNLWLLCRADIVIIGGGGLIFDNEPGVNFQKLLIQWSLRAHIARIFGASILFLGISLEVKNTNNKMLLHRLFRPKDFIILRDEKSVSIIEALGLKCSQIPDIAFLYEPPKPEKLPDKKRVGISVRGGFLGDTESVIPQIYEFLEARGYDPVFLIHTATGNEAQNDTLFIKRVMAGKTYNITGSIEQTLKLYPTLYAVIGMRFHSGVFSCVHEIPFLMISYGPKTDELIKLLEFDEFVIRPEALNMDRFSHLWEHLENNYEARCTHMIEKHRLIRTGLISRLETL